MPYFDLAQLARLSRTSSEHARIMRYIQVYLEMLASVAFGQRTKVKSNIQAFFPYEVLIVGSSCFPLGYELRAGFARLIDAVYLDRYPHFSRTDIRGLLLLSVDSVEVLTADMLLPRFEFAAHEAVIHPSSDLQLDDDGMLRIFEVEAFSVGDEFVLRASKSRAVVP